MTRMPVAAPQRSNVSTLQRIDVSIANRQRKRAVDLRVLRRIVRALLSELLQIRRAELGICLVAAPEMTRLNETFLRHAGATDVIAFDYARQPTPGPSQEGDRASRACLGSPPGRGQGWVLCSEIFVCLDEAVSQARRFRTSWQSELVRYIVHAILHLLGFDDTRPTARRTMKREENRLLRELTSQISFTRLANHRSHPATASIVNRKSKS